MSISNLTEPNDYDLYCRSITIKNSDAELSGIYGAPFLKYPLQNFYTIDTQNPSVTVHKTGDLVIINGEVAISMTTDSTFIRAVLVLPVIPGYNSYDSLKVIGGFCRGTLQIAVLTEADAGSSVDIELVWQQSDGVGFVNLQSYIVNYTVSYRLTNI
jgi:hypothetical protein